MSAGSGYREPLSKSIQSPSETLRGPAADTSAIEEAARLCTGYLRFFSNQFFKVGSPPDWFLNPLNGRHFPNSDLHWSRLSDFDSNFGDIKCIWKLSRFDWALMLARAYRVTGDQNYLTLLNDWASDWTERNPLNIGPNWKCGQEAAIRMSQVLLAAYLLRQYKRSTPGLKRFVVEHCNRIVPTIRYGIAQNNNHGTSEAAGLYIGGAWLFSCCKDNKKIQRKARHWHRLGRRWLENRVRRLVASDGSFSQYSLNYHRVLLDTLNMVEFWRRELQLPEFSRAFYQRARAGVEWLYQIIDPQTGDGPNLGANDGARLFVLSSTDYRDYRPSVQLGAVLFLGEKAYREGPWDEALAWLGLNQRKSTFACPPFLQKKDEEGEMRDSLVGGGTADTLDLGNESEELPLNSHLQKTDFETLPPFRNGEILWTSNPVSFLYSMVSKKRGTPQKNYIVNLQLVRKSCILPDGGYVIMNFEKSARCRSWAVVRFPNFHFRPSHADALHLDLWYNGINLLRDSGMYSYHVDEPWQSYFPSTAAHNTIQFDERDQMPRLGRFLFGDWLRIGQIGELIDHNGTLSWTGSYMDFKKCRHQRTVLSDGLVWKIVDDIAGFDKNAVLRWRLVPGDWVLDGSTCVGELAEISIDCNASITRFELVDGWESRYYMEKTKLPVLEVQVETDIATLTTEIRLRT